MGISSLSTIIVGFVLLDVYFYMQCFVDRCWSFCPFVCLCVVCSSSLYGFWFPFRYLQTLLELYQNKIYFRGMAGNNMYGETHGFGSECFNTSDGYHVSSQCHFIVNSLLNIATFLSIIKPHFRWLVILIFVTQPTEPLPKDIWSVNIITMYKLKWSLSVYYNC